MELGDAHDPLAKRALGTIIEIDDESNILQLKRGGSSEDAEALTALIPGGPLSTDAQQAALTRIAQSFVDGHLQTAHRAAYDLLTGRNPRMHGSSGSVQPARVTAQSVSSAVQSLDASYLFIQGPPGSGKSTIGSQVICDLLHAGKRVGVLSTGHKAIHHLLHKVETCMQERRQSFRGLYKHSQGNAGSQYVSQRATPFIESVDDNDAFGNGGYDLAGGTAWLFSRAELAGTFDYLFIDEAGQVSLADALAVSACAKNVVLLGDPSQLAQVSRGIHALHANDSVLQHLLGEEQTVPPERGSFSTFRTGCIRTSAASSPRQCTRPPRRRSKDAESPRDERGPERIGLALRSYRAHGQQFEFDGGSRAHRRRDSASAARHAGR